MVRKACRLLRRVANGWQKSNEVRAPSTRPTTPARHGAKALGRVGFDFELAVFDAEFHGELTTEDTEITEGLKTEL